MDAVAVALTAIDLASERPFRVGRASIDPVSREATFNGQSERLQPQNLKVLVALARKRGKVVTRDELVDICWNGRFVGDDVINRAISTLRQFAEHVGGVSIETVPRSGYRLVETSSSLKRRQWVIGAIALVILALAGIASLEWARRGIVRPMPTFAVLPFAAASADPQERELASDARDAVAHALSQTEFRVRLASSRQEKDARAADFAVSANVGESSGNIVATVRVEDVVHNVIVYSQVFEANRANAGDLPSRIGAQIAGSLGWTSSFVMLERSHPSDPAITAVLFGQTNSYQTVRQVAANAPHSAVAQIALGYGAAFVLADLPSGQRAEAAGVGRLAMKRVRVLAPGSSDADTLWCWLHSRVRLIECEDHLRAGMKSDPDSPWVGTFLADQLKDVGRTNEALALASNSLGHDPYVPGKIQLTLRMLEATGRRDEADGLYLNSRRWWPDDSVIFSGRVYGTMDRGDFEALARIIKDIEKTKLAPSFQPGLPVIAAIRANDVRKARKLCPVDQAGSFKRDLCMLAFARLGDNDNAFATAARIYPNRIGRTPAEEDKLWLESPRYGETDILMGPAAAALRRDPRYLDLARRLGLLAYWQSGRLPDFCQPPQREPICSRLRRN
ncbi:MAG: winged helix-turn-helix domain-containing protein [Tepidisphaeraceae bacterium]